MRLTDVGGDLLALHHAGARLGQRLFLAGLRIEAGQLFVRVAREIRRRPRRCDACPLGGELRLGFAQRGEG